jgi:hypothetical protein
MGFKLYLIGEPHSKREILGEPQFNRKNLLRASNKLKSYQIEIKKCANFMAVLAI